MEWDRMKWSGVERNEVVIPLFGYFNFNDRMEGGETCFIPVSQNWRERKKWGIGWNRMESIPSYHIIF